MITLPPLHLTLMRPLILYQVWGRGAATAGVTEGMAGATEGTGATGMVVGTTVAAAAAGTPAAPGAGTATTAADCGTMYPEIVLGFERFQGAGTRPGSDVNFLKCYGLTG